MAHAQLTIYGAGLIGGSIALSARRSGTFDRIVAIDLNEAPEPPKVDPFDDWAVSPEARMRALRSSDLTVMCLPVRAIVAQLPEVLMETQGVVTDCGSTKASICRSIADHPRRGRFVAGHPMAGRPVGGLIHASHDLFEARRWILCPEQSDPDAVAIVERLVSSTGAEIITLDADVHDASVAWTSHLPQVIASALSVYAHDNHALQAAGPGFASATRVAGGAEVMWSDIFETNAAPIGLSLTKLGTALCELGEELGRGRAESTLDLLARARALRGTVIK